jgi:hypothetical protein
MHAKTLAAGLAVAALSLSPSCPAPPLAGLIITGIAAPLVGNLIYIGLKSGGVGKRDAEAFIDGLEDLEKRQSWPGVPDYNIQMCRDANVGRTVTVRETSVNCKHLFKITE